MDWPQTSTSFKAFKKELKEAFKQHPPFKKWLKRKRNKNLILACYPTFDLTPFMYTVEELKEIYNRVCKKTESKSHDTISCRRI